MTLFYKSTSVVGGGNKLMYGSKEVQKLMLKDKLVYQNALPKGTVLFEGELVLVRRKKLTLSFPLVANDWHNIIDKLKFSWTYGGTTYNTTVSKEDLEKGFVFLISGNNTEFITMKINGANGITAKPQDYSTVITTITKVELV